MKNRGILKFKGSESRGAMHFINYNNKFVSLTQKTSRKVKHIAKHNKLNIAISLLSRDFNEKRVTIIEDNKMVEEVFNYMKNEKHTHYKKSADDLVVLTYTDMWYTFIYNRKNTVTL